MPRVEINKKKYLHTDLREWIVGRMRTLHRTQADMGNLVGLSQPAFKNRLDKSMFEYGQLLEIFKALQATDEEILRLMKL